MSSKMSMIATQLWDSPADILALKRKGGVQSLELGRRSYLDEMHPAFRPTALSSWVATLTMSIMSCSFHVYLLVLCFCWVSSWVRALLVILLASLLLPADKWSRFKSSWLFKTWREALKISFITEHILDPADDRSYLCCCIQHGVVPYTVMAAASMEEKLFPDRNRYAVVSSYLFWLPVVRHIVGWLGGITATKENIQRLLRPGRSMVFLHPGGLAEMCLASRSKERVHLKDRKGFVRLAVEGGHCLFPMYIFGQSEILSLWCPDFLASLSRKFGFPIGLLYGRYGLPIPRRRDILVVASKPIEVGQPLPRNHPNFNAKVDKIHQEFVTEVARVFEQYKSQYGWSHKTLEVH